MTKTLFLVSLAVMAVTLQAQTPTSPGMTPSTTQTGSNFPATTPDSSQALKVQPASLTAELTKSIDSKKAKVGDPVNAKTTTEAKLPNGTDLPKGTKLVGNVVDVKAKTKEDKNSHLVLALNRAVLKDGQEVPIRAAVTSVTAPAENASNGMAAMPSAGGGSMSAPSGGGASPGGGSTSATAPTPSAPAMSTNTGSQAQSTPGQMLKSTQDRVAVGNKPNVILSAPTTPDSAGVLDGNGDNISLASGTKLTLNVIPAQPGT
ncbi:hypothetical protein [Edaphobacter albus]|uniref:hypothetical protein n=1 Tax=Edaphobacter sp. 4G125 TaxID=2763071 RepID=UPI0016472C50|nr:hypothetical protein [Edaphobacter sp. 4G125]QNI37878.1 hypothetical protein H7846_06300 [Edaphobacter sp. 4G125]